jgi:hypothetical protein
MSGSGSDPTGPTSTSASPAGSTTGGTEPQPGGADSNEENLAKEPDDTWEDWELRAEVRELITLLRFEVGWQWMSIDLRYQIEKIEHLM